MDEPEARPGRAASRTRNVRFGGLEPAIESAAAAAGLTVSAWLRRVAAAHAGGERAAESRPPGDHGEAAKGDESRRRVALRVDGDELARWTAEAEEYGLSLTRYVEWQMAGTRDRAARVAEMVRAVQAALVHVAPIGRNLNQIARSWNTYPGQSSKEERALLAANCADVERFCAQAAAIVGEFQARRGRRRRTTGA